MDSNSLHGASSDGPIDLKVFTLNCWGLKCLSEKRRERMEAIGNHLAVSDYDVVYLQEVWCKDDFELIRELSRTALPHGHFFDNGIIGTGTCILTRAQIRDATFHEFAMNGYPHKLWHGDWFGGKGLGVCQIMYKGFDLHLYVSHYHAEYDRRHDVYLGHRVIHALESAQWIKLSSSSADLTIYGGDFNTEPVDVPYKLVRAITPLVDSWSDAHGSDVDGGHTSETPANSFSHPKTLIDYPDGKRIDYVMYQPGPNVTASTVSCQLPLPSRIPGKNFSYSDHEAVCATITVRRKKGVLQSAADYRRRLCAVYRPQCVSAVDEALRILERSERHVHRDKVRYAVIAALMLILFVASYVPLALLGEGSGSTYIAVVEVALFLPRFVLTVCFVFFILMATLFNRRESHALRSAKVSLTLIKEQDGHGPLS